jgi:hypothetical protein
LFGDVVDQKPVEESSKSLNLCEWSGNVPQFLRRKRSSTGAGVDFEHSIETFFTRILPELTFETVLQTVIVEAAPH